MKTRHPTPLEVWNRAVHSYESIPDDPYVSRRSRHPKRRWLPLAILVPITVLGLICLAMYAYLGSNYTADTAHQETVVPTLLSVVYSQNKTLIYALKNPLYSYLETAEILSRDTTQNRELPGLCRCGQIANRPRTPLFDIAGSSIVEAGRRPSRPLCSVTRPMRKKSQYSTALRF